MFNEKEYQQQYQEKNHDRIREQRKEYRRRNAEAIRENKRLYGLKPEVKIKHRIRSSELYKKNRDKVLARQTARRKERLGFINGIALRYGCQNPDCKWQGELISSQLDFHHFDPKIKITEVAKMESWSYEKIIQEINKCVVLCKNCHTLVHAGNIKVYENMRCEIYLQ